MFHFSKRIYTFLIILAIPAVFIGSMLAFGFLAFKYHELRRFPFYDLYIGQLGSNIAVNGLLNGSGAIIQSIDYNKKKIIFTLTGSNDELKSSNEFPLNGLVGYDMCYQNKYGEHCFGKTK